MRLHAVSPFVVLSLSACQVVLGIEQVLPRDSETFVNEDGSVMGELVDDGVIVRYYIDDVTSEPTPAQLFDSAPEPRQSLTIDYKNGLSFVDSAQGHGLQWPEYGQDGRAWTPITGTKIAGRLQDSTTGTIEVVVTITHTHELGSRVSHIGSGTESGRFSLKTYDPTRLWFYNTDGEHRGEWSIPSNAEQPLIVHLVYNTELDDELDRATLYINGAPAERLSGMPLMPGETLDVSGDKDYVLGNRDAERSFTGALYYAAMYHEALTADDVARNAAILRISNDAP